MRTREPLIDWLSARRHHQREWFPHSLVGLQQQHVCSHSIRSSCKRRENVHTQLERPIGFHQKIYDPLFTSLLGGGGGIFISPMHRGAFCEKGLPCLCTYELYGEWKGEMKTFPTTILTYWHFTVHRLKALFSQKIPPRFLYSLWRSSVKENYKSIGLPFSPWRSYFNILLLKNKKETLKLMTTGLWV